MYLQCGKEDLSYPLDICIEIIGYNEEGGKEYFAAWEDEMEAYFEKYGSEKGGSGVETAHNDFADTKN
ncbi:hypothetical protein Tco_0579794, partial [Tanacetum coccineum]